MTTLRALRHLALSDMRCGPQGYALLPHLAGSLVSLALSFCQR